MSSLKDKTINSAFWAFLQRIGTSGFQLIVSIVLARLLLPDDFGLIGMLSIFIALSETLVQAGFSQALIQKKDADEEHFSSVFYINFVTSITIYFILFFSAPFISDFYNQPKLTGLTRVLSLIFIINSFGYVQETRLRKSMEFKKLMYISLPSTIISGVVSVSMAYLGFGVWALVTQRLVSQVLFNTQLWFYSKWKPLLSFNKQKAKGLFDFGSKLMISNVIHTITDNLYQMSIGKFYNAQLLGYYENSNRLTSSVTFTISSVLNSVAFPAFASIQDENERLRIGYKKVMQQVLFWLTPMLVIAAVLAEPLFQVLFGEKWIPAVPYFQILCLASIFTPLTEYNLNILAVKGRSDIHLRLEIIKKTFLVIGVVICIPLGVMALVVFRLIYSIVVYFLNSSYSGRFIGYSTMSQLKDITPILLLSFITAIVIHIFNLWLIEYTYITRLITGALTGMMFFYGVSALLKIDPYLDFKGIVIEKIKNRMK